MKQFEYATHEDIVAGNKPNLSRTMLAFSLGGPPFNRMALATAVMSWRALKIEPTTAIVIHVGGYDDDPRELWQIPEVMNFVRKFCEKTRAHEHPAMDPQSRAVLLACGADPTKHVHVDMISKEESLRRSGEFFKERLKEED